VIAVLLFLLALLCAAVGLLAAMDPEGRGRKLLAWFWSAAIFLAVAAIVVGVRAAL
jgi:Na+/glutamate symporter